MNSVNCEFQQPAKKIVRLRLSTGRYIDIFSDVLFREPNSLLAEWARQQNFIDCSHRDAKIVRLLVNCLRSCVDEEGRPNGKKFTPPEDFGEWRPLLAEARYWRVPCVERVLREASAIAANTITIGYHGTLAAGRGGFEVNFRRIDRILVCGKARACREVFGRFLNETRDWNMDNQRYTSRFYLIYPFVEQAFDALAAHRFRLLSSSSSTPRFFMGKNAEDELSFSQYTQHVFARYS